MSWESVCLAASSSTNPSGAARWNPQRWEGWERNQWAIYAAVLISYLSFTFVMPFLPQYVQQLGVRDPDRAALWAGLLFGISPLLGGILTPFWASVAERTGNKPMVLRSLICYVIAIGLMGLCTNVWQLLALRILLGIFSGFSAFAVAVLSVTVPKDRVSQSIGTLQSVQFGAAALGPIFGGTLADTVGLRNAFFISAVINVGACFVFVWLFDAAHDRAATPQRKERASVGVLARLPGLLPIMVTLCAVSFIERTFGPLIPLYVQQLHAPERLLGTIAGAVITLGSLAAAIAASTMGRLSRFRNPRNLLLLTLTGGGLVLIPITMAQEWWQLLFLRPMLDIFIGGNTTLTYAIAARTLPAQWKLTAFGALGGLAMIGGAAAPFASGAVTELTHSLRTIFGLDALLYLLLLLWAWKAIRLPAEEPPAPVLTATGPVAVKGSD
jgi:DHA1 family multidrug resistance protein-like MFS transporter